MSKQAILFAVGVFRAHGLSEAYAQIVAARVLEPGAVLSASDAAWLAKFREAVLLTMSGSSHPRARQASLARVLERMVVLMGSSGSISFGNALEQACAELGLTVVRGSQEEQALLIAASKIAWSGRIPGAPDA